ncbi:BolA protein [Saprolegnia diclina VS20]|uniref:BolA protein n=1 Tax=Saprolegnia diclina (strain VS20) TaxID=1156394 RepID=T0S5Y1_SAPDV|nr:BolA protein [Saprolegnia diclina VS20]EQC40483.1 BolA protein [Saprolegnia diclina VS20]|eukprot:XP_008606182.1 BolA protein [Saprolegnia diclina VS20]
MLPSFVRTFSRASTMATTDGSIFSAIQTKLAAAFAPTHLQVLNESYMHNVPKGSETHFKVIVVSDHFEGKPLLQRHRMVNAVLDDELTKGGVHALSIQSKTPSQWEANSTVRPSPTCQGGMKHEKKTP